MHLSPVGSLHCENSWSQVGGLFLTREKKRVNPFTSGTRKCNHSYAKRDAFASWGRTRLIEIILTLRQMASSRQFHFNRSETCIQNELHLDH